MTNLRMMNSKVAATGLAERLAAVQQRIRAACERAGRDPRSVVLIAVSKTHPVEGILEAHDAGVRDFGENRVQEAMEKLEDPRLAALVADFHLIGHLQTNKARDAVGSFSLIHSVDSERLLRRIDGMSTEPQRLLLEVNVADEASKFGLTVAEVASVVRVARDLPHIAIEGLMTVAPRATDPDDLRPVFRALRELAAEHGLGALSMGMTDDFEIAIEEGATHVRVGRAIFGERSA